MYSFEQKPYCTQEDVSLVGVGIGSLKIITRIAQKLSCCKVSCCKAQSPLGDTESSVRIRELLLPIVSRMLSSWGKEGGSRRIRWFSNLSHKPWARSALVWLLSLPSDVCSRPVGTVYSSCGVETLVTETGRNHPTLVSLYWATIRGKKTSLGM